MFVIYKKTRKITMSRETKLINSFCDGRIFNEKRKENVIKKKIVFALKTGMMLQMWSRPSEMARGSLRCSWSR